MQTIELNNLSFSYGKYSNAPIILSEIDFKAKGNESIGIIGANGVGKSTLLKILVGLLAEYEGKAYINDLEINQHNIKQIREKTGYIFQDSDSQLFMSKVYEDVAFGPSNYGYTGKELDERVMNALEMVNIANLRDKQIYRLSGGQKKLVSIATILAMKPDIILLDEPSVALDPKNRRNLINILNSIDCLKIIASHDLDFIFDTCERTILLSNAKIVKDGYTKTILSDEKLLDRSGLELPLSLINRQL